MSLDITFLIIAFINSLFVVYFQIRKMKEEIKETYSSVKSIIWTNISFYVGFAIFFYVLKLLKLNNIISFACLYIITVLLFSQSIMLFFLNTVKKYLENIK